MDWPANSTWHWRSRCSYCTRNLFVLRSRFSSCWGIDRVFRCKFTLSEALTVLAWHPPRPEGRGFRFSTIFFTAKPSTAMAQVFTHQSSCQLVKKILTCIANSFMHSRDFQTGFIAVVRTFLFTAQRFLRSTQLDTFRLKALRISDTITILW